VTLIVGIKCKDGALLAADSATTVVNVAGQSTIQTPLRKKLQILADQLIVGVSGDVGLGQAIAGVIEMAWRNRHFEGASVLEVAEIARKAIWSRLKPEFEIAQVAAPVLGQTAIAKVCTATSLAIPVEGEACLYQFENQGMPSRASENLPVFALGSGQMIADPFLAFLRRIFWTSHLPTLAEGILAAVWTLQHAIATHPGGVGGDIQLAVLRRQGEKWLAAELPEADWEEHKQDIRSAEHVLAEFRRYLQLEAGAIPPPPAPLPG
jgi:Proteasome subunit